MDTFLLMSSGSPGERLQVELADAAKPLSAAWDGLADRLAAPPFVRPGWILAWSRAFGNGQLRALTATRGGELVGLVPVICRRGIVSAPVNWHTPLFSFLAVDQEVTAGLAREFVTAAKVRADLTFLERSDPTLAECQSAAERAGRPWLVRDVMRSPYVQIEGADWESYQASFSRKFRKDMRRRHRRLEEEGTLTVEHTAGDADFEQALERGFELEASGWKDERGSAIVSDPRTHRFYSDIARWARDRGWLSMAFLRLGDKRIAFDLCLVSDGVVYVLKGGFDPAYRRLSAGNVLTFESLRFAFERGRRSYEFLGDDAPYKLVWTDQTRELMRFQAFGSSPRAIANRLAWERGRPAVLRARRLASRSRTDVGS
jgi:CelD/BcsL family acetyltransferase involved in cellulose biosynthesis